MGLVVIFNVMHLCLNAKFKPTEKWIMAGVRILIQLLVFFPQDVEAPLFILTMWQDFCVFFAVLILSFIDKHFEKLADEGLGQQLKDLICNDEMDFQENLDEEDLDCEKDCQLSQEREKFL